MGLGIHWRGLELTEKKIFDPKWPNTPENDSKIGRFWTPKRPKNPIFGQKKIFLN
jgi:hypothetical protein